MTKSRRCTRMEIADALQAFLDHGGQWRVRNLIQQHGTGGPQQPRRPVTDDHSTDNAYQWRASMRSSSPQARQVCPYRRRTEHPACGSARTDRPASQPPRHRHASTCASHPQRARHRTVEGPAHDLADHHDGGERDHEPGSTLVLRVARAEERVGVAPVRKSVCMESFLFDS